MPPFLYISDLPPQIRETLDIPLQELWLQSFNAAMTLTSNEAESYQTAWLKVFQASFPGEIATIPQMAPQPESQSAVAPYTQTALSEHKAGYWVDLDSIKFNDAGSVTWLQALPVGTYTHPIHGKIEVTPERVQRFALNVKSKVRGTDLDIDYDHKEKSGEAAGWVKDAEARSDGLWLAVEWTQDALSKLKNKAYRYFSPEFVDAWTHPKTNQKFQDVLFGGALTNRPFLKDILPINLSEVILSGGYMLKEMAKLLGLPEDADEATILAAMQTRLEATPVEPAEQTEEAPPAPPAETPSENQPTTQPASPTATAQPVAASEVTAEVIALAEADPVVRSLVDRIAILESATRLSEVDAAVKSLSDGKVAVQPAIAQKLRDTALEMPKQFADKMLALVGEIVKSGVVELGERGTLTHERDTTATKQFSDKVTQVMEARKVDYATAADIVASENPQLFTEYRSESFVRESV